MSDFLSVFNQYINEPVVLVWLILSLLIVTYTDVKTLKIPNKVNGFIAIVNIIIFVLIPLIQGDWQSSLTSMGSALIGFVVLLIPSVVTGFNMAGDIKFIGAFGFALTPISMFLFLGVSLVTNIFTNGSLIIMKKKTYDDVIPFAPFFLISFLMLIGISWVIL